jgi:hypothetical protein
MAATAIISLHTESEQKAGALEIMGVAMKRQPKYNKGVIIGLKIPKHHQ